MPLLACIALFTGAGDPLLGGTAGFVAERSDSLNLFAGGFAAEGVGCGRAPFGAGCFLTKTVSRRMVGFLPLELVELLESLPPNMFRVYPAGPIGYLA